MQGKKYLGALATALMIFIAVLTRAGFAAASSYEILHVFTGAPEPSGNLTRDAAGNLYGTTFYGGSGYGVVYKLMPNSHGTWTYSVLYSFKGGADGANPQAGLTLDAAGNLYGTTRFGGDLECLSPSGCGVVFKLKPNLDGTWTESVLHSFSGGADGANPAAELILRAGNLYGTTVYGGVEIELSGFGVVFKLEPCLDGTWMESVLHSFSGGADGANPQAALTLDAAGNLYGTTAYGGVETGISGSGVVFKLRPNLDGTWTEKVLHRFAGGADGANPAGVILDMAGNAYGTTVYGGDVTCNPSFGCGVVFKLKPNPDGTWTKSVLHSFDGGADGSLPTGGVILDAAANLYGTTYCGGAYGRDDFSCNTDLAGYGTVFKLAPTASGWSETVLHSFSGYGKYPLAGVILDRAGNLYGTTVDGSTNGGLVFKITQ
jgi:uncharacterized repeat protein (TIGR03803 family)